MEKILCERMAMIGKRAIVTYDRIIYALKENRELPFNGGEVQIVDGREMGSNLYP